MKSVLSISVLGLAIALGSLPAVAGQVTGPRGGTVSGNGFVVPNHQGGYTGVRQSSFTTPYGTTGNRQRQFQTNGQDSVTYSGSSSATRANGQPVNATTSGTSSYNATTGYSGQNTTTVNGKTYTTSTQNGSTTVITPTGSYTYTPRRFR